MGGGDKAASQDPLGEGASLGPRLGGLHPLVLGGTVLSVYEPGLLTGGVRRTANGTVLALLVLFSLLAGGSSLGASEGRAGFGEGQKGAACGGCRLAPGRLLGLPCPLRRRAGKS